MTVVGPGSTMIPDIRAPYCAHLIFPARWGFRILAVAAFVRALRFMFKLSE